MKQYLPFFVGIAVFILMMYINSKIFTDSHNMSLGEKCVYWFFTLSFWCAAIIVGILVAWATANGKLF